MAEEAQQLETSTAEAENLSTLDKIVQQGRMARDDSQKARAKDMVTELAKQVLEGHMTISHDTVAMINNRIAQIDELISSQLNAIMHAPEFQKLEASWRGLQYLVSNTETSTTLKLRLLNASRSELQKDLEKAVEFDQSQLFKKIYEEEFGVFGGHPFGLLMGDFEFG
ncbi:MAG: type VI secretion system contractile sheath large subunit, partial [Pseudomonadota bacterium]|nr:type VI secretion system contractile sheath large subunit [Pseudomonadota bacterium]